MGKRLLERFVLDTLKSGSFNLVKDKATVNAHGVCHTVHSPECLYKHIGTLGCYILAYRRGVQALLVSTGGRCQSLRVWDE